MKRVTPNGKIFDPPTQARAYTPRVTIPERVDAVMRRLEVQDARDRTDGSPRERRLRQIPREVGEFLRTLAVATDARAIVEIGTSKGYSTL